MGLDPRVVRLLTIRADALSIVNKHGQSRLSYLVSNRDIGRQNVGRDSGGKRYTRKVGLTEMRKG